MYYPVSVALKIGSDRTFFLNALPSSALHRKAGEPRKIFSFNFFKNKTRLHCSHPFLKYRSNDNIRKKSSYTLFFHFLLHFFTAESKSPAASCRSPVRSARLHSLCSAHSLVIPVEVGASASFDEHSFTDANLLSAAARTEV